MATATSHLDEATVAWETDPAYLTTCEQAYRVLLDHVPQIQEGGKKPDILEIGCGSGILASMLAPHAHTLIGIDPSVSAVAAYNAKAKERGHRHMEAVAFDWEHPDFGAAPQTGAKLMQRVEGAAREGPVRYDLILSNPLTESWPNLKDWFQISYFGLAAGGTVVMISLEHTGPDSALFYPPSRRGNATAHGYKAEEVVKNLKDTGFVEVSVKKVFSVEKAVDPAEAGGRTSIEFPFVLCRASKPSR